MSECVAKSPWRAEAIVPGPAWCKTHDRAIEECARDKDAELARLKETLRKVADWAECDHPRYHSVDPVIYCAGPGKCQTLIDIAEARRALEGTPKEAPR